MFENKTFKSSCNLLIECREYSVKVYPQIWFSKSFKQIK